MQYERYRQSFFMARVQWRKIAHDDNIKENIIQNKE